jgi:hypothetical protein
MSRIGSATLPVRDEVVCRLSAIEDVVLRLEQQMLRMEQVFALSPPIEGKMEKKLDDIEDSLVEVLKCMGEREKASDGALLAEGENAEKWKQLAMTIVRAMKQALTDSTAGHVGPRMRATQKKFEIHQVLVDVLLDSVDVMTTVVRTGLSATQLNVQRGKLESMEARVDAVVDEAETAYDEEERHLEEGTKLVTRLSRVQERVSKTRDVVERAVAKKRFTSGVDREGVVGRVAIAERLARQRRYVQNGNVGVAEAEVISLVETDSSEEETDRDMELEGLNELSEESEEEIDSQESDDEIPE